MQGSCCCGAVAFALTAPPTMMAVCHCSRCRKVGASAFVFVARETFVWVRGAEDVTRFAPDAPYKFVRSFCAKCGSALGEIGSEAASFPVAANLFDDALELRPRFHEFVAEKPDWYDICDTAKQFALHPVKAD